MEKKTLFLLSEQKNGNNQQILENLNYFNDECKC